MSNKYYGPKGDKGPRGPWGQCPKCGIFGDVKWDGKTDTCICLNCGYSNDRELEPIDYDAPGYRVREQGV